MNWNTYMGLFDDILEKRNILAPYDNPDYFHYVQMNKARSDRWLKRNPLSEETINIIKSIDTPQKWILITEPWCGDAAHSTPIIYLMSELNPHISLEIVLRDSSNLIDSYLTNGGKSIPKLVVRDENDNDLFDWGPRPAEAQKIVLDMKADNQPYAEVNKVIQNWYNKDKAVSVQEELNGLFAKVKV
ncbi:MAG: thioredoxin family protein [bacterium]|nr:thioredoxin family protein [bacterium]